MPRTIVYKAGGFTNCGIGYTKFSQEELAEMKDRVMTENEAIEELKYDCNELGKAIPCDTSWGKSLENAYAMAIKALEEVQRWHTSVINPNIKNEFANISTQICHNCDHKDEYIEELEAEVEEYRAIGTVEECRAAVEKQTVKKVKSISQVKDGDSYGGLIGRCPCCGDILEEDTVYCDCGQRLDWGTSDETD